MNCYKYRNAFKFNHYIFIILSYLHGIKSTNDSSQASLRNPIHDSYSNEPLRDQRLIARSVKPYNGETPVELLGQYFYTPNEIFYIRNNLPVPFVDGRTFYFTITGIGITPTTITLAQLRTFFPPISITSVLQCAGNRRAEMNMAKPVSGTLWGGGAIGNANWTGASLKTVLASAGFDPGNYHHPEYMHIQFEGLDVDLTTGEHYGASIPYSYLLDGNFEPLLAYSMNSQTLSPDHGFPLRAILPGIVGARNVKWLHKIIVSYQESQTEYQQKKYKMFAPSVTQNTVGDKDYKNTPAIMNLPVTSYITWPENGQNVTKGGWNLVRGYAYSGGGRYIVRVEISQDQGMIWQVANVTQKQPTICTKSWSWIFWEANLNFSTGLNELWVKAVDNDYNQQPKDTKFIWNYGGYLTNSYAVVAVNVLN